MPAAAVDDINIYINVDIRENMNASSEIFITQHGLTAVCALLLFVAYCFVVPAIYVRWNQRLLLKGEVYFIYSAVFWYTAYMVDWLVVMPYIYRVNRVALGLGPVYPTFVDDVKIYIKLVFTSSLLGWNVLWSVKASLLWLYRDLMRNLPAHKRWWWAVVTYTSITYVFAFVTLFTCCGGPTSFNRNPTAFCTHPRDNMTRNLSFYGAFACDVTTDIAIVILPVCVIWKVQLPLRRKFGIGAMFCVAVFCIVAAVIRLVQIDSKTGSQNPNTEWIVLWGSVEATTAIVVGCIPSCRYFRTFAQPRASDYTYSSDPSSVPHGHSRPRSLSTPVMYIPLGEKTGTSTSNVDAASTKSGSPSHDARYQYSIDGVGIKTTYAIIHEPTAEEP